MRLRLSCRVTWPAFELACEADWPLQGVTALFGESGSGKTTLLRVIAGLHRDPRTRLSFGEECWQDGRRFRPVDQRGLGWVSQQGDLFPHLSVRGNLDFAFQRRRGRKGPETYSVIHSLGLEDLLDRLPAQLSGGQRQRVALGRALLAAPKLLLLDEPLASLDAAGKAELLPALERLRLEADCPVLYVSHSPDEVARLADRLVLLEQGRILGEGETVPMLCRLDLPLAEREDAEALLEATVTGSLPGEGLSELALPGGTLWVTQTALTPGSHVRVRLLARDISLALQEPRECSILNRLPAVIREIGEAKRGQVTLRLDCAGQQVLSRITERSRRELGLAPGMRVVALVKGVAVLA